jgi:hydroxymethylbilane synthase
MRNGRIHLRGVVANPDGSQVLRESGEGSDPQKLGEELGESLLRRGGDAILQEVYGQAVTAPQQP